MFVIFGHMIDQSGLPAVRLGAAQLLSRNLLTCRGFHQRRAGKEDRSLIAHNHGFVRHGLNIRTARSAASHDASDLENALCARSDEHTSELHSLISIYYDCVCSKNKK